jgi:cytochrome P450
MGFALQEAMIVLAHLTRVFRFDLVAGHVVRPIQRITLRPQGGMPMTMHTR